MLKNQIDKKTVFDICDGIHAATGKDPTCADVTKALGGSHSTIHPYLQVWREQRRLSILKTRKDTPNKRN